MAEHEIILNSACCSIAICFALVLVFFIMSITFNPREDQRHNNLTLIPYYSCLAFSLIIVSETIFINADSEPQGRSLLFFRYL